MFKGLQQTNAIDGVDHRHQRQGFLNLVALEMSDEVPADIARQCGCLVPQLLRPVFTQIQNTRLDNLPGDLHVNHFGHGHQGHVRAQPSRTPASGRDAFLNSG